MPVAVAALLATIACGGRAHGQEAGETKRQEVEFYPARTEVKKHPVTLSFDAKVYPKGSWFSKLQEKGALGADEKFLVGSVKANADGTLDDVLALWLPEERDEIRKLASNTELWEGNRNFYRMIRASAFVSKIFYGAYVIFFVEHTGTGFEPMIKPYPVKEVDGRYYFTNALQDDPIFQYFTTAYAKTLPVAKAP